MLNVILNNTKPIKVKELSYDDVVKLISETDPLISADYHIMKYINKRHDLKQYSEYYAKTQKIIKHHNSIVSNNDTFLFLGDISEKEMCKPEDIAKLKSYISRLNAKVKIMVIGNNDNFNYDFYKSCGFKYVCKELPFFDIIFTHEPVDLKSKKYNKYKLNIHGHIHGSKSYRNMDPKRHVDVYWDNGYFSPKRLSVFLKEYKDGKHNDGIKRIATFDDDNQV